MGNKRAIRENHKSIAAPRLSHAFDMCQHNESLDALAIRVMNQE